ncbi:hypothetical protein Tco_0044512 [Tanacetum coccineum]
MSDKKTIQSNPPPPEKSTEATLQQHYTTPNYGKETQTGGSSSEQHTHQPMPPITDGFHTEKEHQQLLLDEEALRETLEEQARAEKEWEERIKKEQAKDELFMLEWEERIKKETKFTFLLPMYRL